MAALGLGSAARPSAPTRLARCAGSVVFLLAIGAPDPATADLFRCTGPDGRTVFTDSRATCPGANEYEPRGAVQGISNDEEATPAAPMPRPRSVERPAPDDRRAEKAVWQHRKQEKQQELAHLETRAKELKEYLTACNRGVDILARDEAGIKYRIPCDRIQREYDEKTARIEPLREYLDSGLARECRRAGCLPGWIR